MKEYRGWQANPKNSFPSEISAAVQSYIDRYGFPPQVLEISDQLEKVELPEGLQMVVSAVRIPKNILLLGSEESEAV